MKAVFHPSHPKGRIEAPPSKSMAHRLLIGGALAQGRSVIHGIADSDDVRATLACLSSLGAAYTQEKDTVYIEGIDPRVKRKTSPLPCHESGSTLRFLAPLCWLGGGERTLVGSETLFSRPLSVYEALAKEQGLSFSLTPSSLTLNGCLAAGDYRIPGNISSQFISGLFFALPLLKKDSTVTILPPLESGSYLSLTVDALSRFGIKIEKQDERHYVIQGNQTYRPTEAWVEGDYSGAAFFDALTFLGGEVEVAGLRQDSLQGDSAYRRIFPLLDAGVPSVHLGDCPDLAPVLTALAAAKNGAVFCGTRRLKLKESDRGRAMAKELAKFGTSVSLHDDSIVVYPAAFHAPTVPLCGHNDHRIVMALCTLLAVTGGEIEGAEAVKKSMPDYFEKLRQIGVEVEVDETLT